MVTINLTLLVELGLFLVFLWGTSRFILRPVLAQIDAREEAITSDQVKAQSEQIEAERLETEYLRAMSEARTRADEEFRRARHQTRQEHQVFVAEERDRADEAVAAFRMEAQRAAEDIRNEVLAIAPELVNELTQKLGGEASPNA